MSLRHMFRVPFSVVAGLFAARACHFISPWRFRDDLRIVREGVLTNDTWMIVEPVTYLFPTAGVVSPTCGGVSGG